MTIGGSNSKTRHKPELMPLMLPSRKGDSAALRETAWLACRTRHSQETKSTCSMVGRLHISFDPMEMDDTSMSE
jgi:hypothetical protein